MGHATLIPVSDYLASVPRVPSAGCALVHAQSGSVEGVGRNLYALLSSGGDVPTTVPQLWYYDTWSDGWLFLTPPLGGEIRGGANMCCCAARRQLYTVLPTAGVGLGFVFRRYDIDTDVWTNLAVPVGLGFVWNSDSAILHLCRAENTSVSDNDIYLISPDADDARLRMYRYNITTGLWATCSTAGGVRGGAPGVGCMLEWLPSRSTNILYSPRGGGSPIIDTYNITAAAWGVQAFVPNYTSGPTTGFSSFYDPDIPAMVIYGATPLTGATNAGIFYTASFDTPTSAALRFQLNARTPGFSGTAHVGKMACFVRPDDGYAWYYALKHSEHSFSRILRPI